MRRRTVAVLVAVLLALGVAGALWAEYGARAEGKATCASEADRCSMTCTMLTNHWNKKFGTMKAHEGDKQCWEICWRRMGKEGAGSAAELKALWMENMASNMRANQCAQACWRKSHDNSSTVEVGGWRSTPRSIVCTP